MLNCKLKNIRMQEFMLNCKEFVEYLDISKSQYHKYEKMINQPVLETALKIAKTLNRSVHDIWNISEE